MTDLLVASRNRKKLAELHRVLDAAGVSGVTLLSLQDVDPFDESISVTRRIVYGKSSSSGIMCFTAFSASRP